MQRGLSDESFGVLCGVTAYTLWGVFPIYFKLLEGVAAYEIVAYRALWSFGWLAVALAARRRWPDFLACFGSLKRVLPLAVSAVLITTNWGFFVYAVETHRVMQSSLAYFINPLVSILLGMCFLGERLRALQWCAVGLACVGVAVFAIAAGGVPWLALVLAFSFGLYGLARKTVHADGLVGLSVEMAIAMPIAATLVAWLNYEGVSTGANLRTQLLLVLAGPVTISPLLLFIAAARRLPLSTVGMMQYICPTLHFVVALGYGEPFGVDRLVSFAFIWSAVAIYVVDAYRQRSGVKLHEDDDLPDDSEAGVTG